VLWSSVTHCTGCFPKNIPVMLLGARFKSRNFISEPGPREPCRHFEALECRTLIQMAPGYNTRLLIVILLVITLNSDLV
jgi:hypothetical protein